jgi:acetyl esterase/lipase
MPGLAVLLLTMMASLPAVSSAASYSIDRDVVYRTCGDVKLKADIYRPRHAGLRPGVVMIHGGAWMSGSKTHVALHAMRIAKRGYVVMAIDYRLAPKHKFPAQIEDCRAAVQWLRRNAKTYRVDGARIAAYGYSAGGHLACLLGTAGETDPGSNESCRVQAVVAGGAPCEFRSIPDDSKFLSLWLGGTRSEKPDLYESACPASYVSPNDPPVFFFHGEHDKLVPASNPRVLETALKNAGVMTEMHLVKNAGHLATYLDVKSIDLAAEFLDRVLK